MFNYVLQQLFFVVILCGVKFEEVEVVVDVFYVEGFCVIEVLLNLFDVLDFIGCLVCCMLVDVVVGVGIVFSVQVVVDVQVVGGCVIVMLYVDVVVICEVKVCGLFCVLGVVMLIEVFVVVQVGVDVVKLFFVEFVMFFVVKVMWVVLFCELCLLLVGGIMFDNMVFYVKVGVVGFGLGFVFYSCGFEVVEVVWCVCVFVQVWCVL